MAVNSTLHEAENAIVIKNLTKKYDDFSLKNVSFTVPKGSIMGFVGENGAGKTTTIKAILDLIRMDEGEITVQGASSKLLPKQIKSEIGVVFDGSNLHDNMNVGSINIVMRNIYPNWDEKRYEEYVEKFELSRKKIIKGFLEV